MRSAEVCRRAALRLGFPPRCMIALRNVPVVSTTTGRGNKSRRLLRRPNAERVNPPNPPYEGRGF